MSGAEVGLVLSILPLLISTVEHYDDILQPFKRFKNYDSEIKKFRDELASEQVIFHAESLLLLSSITTYDIAMKMLEEPNHPSWKDSDLESKLRDFLGSSRSACESIVDLIKKDLCKIQEESQFFNTVPYESSVPPVQADRMAWRERIGRKLKWSLSNSQLQKRLKELRCHVKILQRHSSQINRVMDRQKSIKQDQKELSTVHTIAESRFVQEAAAELYVALVNACKAHHEHILHFRLETRHFVDAERPSVRFQMAFVQSVLDANPNPIWVAIESEFGDPSMILGKKGMESLENTVNTVRSHLKRTGEPNTEHTQSKRTKKNTERAVHFSGEALDGSKPELISRRSSKSCLKKAIFSPWKNSFLNSDDKSSFSGIETDKGSEAVSQIPNESSIPIPITSRETQINILSGPLPDFCQQNDLCKHIQQWSTTNCRTTDACIGYLRREQTYSHRVLVTPQLSDRQKTPISLLQLISSRFQQPQSYRFLYIDSIRLAKHLASAILLFHATPILRETWRSEDIVFYNDVTTLKRSRPSLANPHLSVRITESQVTSCTQNTSQTRLSVVSYDKRIRNPYTYGLGITLLELAHQEPLSKLKEEVDLISGPEDLKTEFEAANSISETVSTDMGLPFQKIVQKCLNCDFGSGSDLRDPGLQSAFYKDVICKLEDIESKLNRLQLEE